MDQSGGLITQGSPDRSRPGLPPTDFIPALPARRPTTKSYIVTSRSQQSRTSRTKLTRWKRRSEKPEGLVRYQRCAPQNLGEASPTTHTPRWWKSGRHTGLRLRRLRACEFDPRLGDQFMEACQSWSIGPALKAVRPNGYASSNLRRFRHSLSSPINRGFAKSGLRHHVLSVDILGSNPRPLASFPVSWVCSSIGRAASSKADAPCLIILWSLVQVQHGLPNKTLCESCLVEFSFSDNDLAKRLAPHHSASGRVVPENSTGTSAGTAQ